VNTVHLSGTIEAVSVRNFTKWVAASVKLKSEEVETWVDIKGVQPGSKEVETLPELKGKHVFIEGYLNSREAPAKDDKPARTVYSVAASAKRIKEIPGSIGTGFNNSVVLVGRVEDAKTNSSGELFAKLSIAYWKPSSGEFGKRYIRIKCPEGTTLETKRNILVTGSVSDNNGALVDASVVHAC
jgi:hypothetical protein